MRILALIPARGGSKRLPGKNTRYLGGLPLIVWTIRVTAEIPEVCDTLVSTDEEAIRAIALDAGATVPWLRPPALATDTASSVDVGIHALDWYERERHRVDGLLLLQPTSPFRSSETVRRGIALYRETGRPVVSVSPARSHPLLCFTVEGSRLRPFAAGCDVGVRSQDLPAVYEPNGAFYLIDPEELRRRHSYYGEDLVPLVIDDPAESVDIDTEWDWMVAEAALARRRSADA